MVGYSILRGGRRWAVLWEGAGVFMAALIADAVSCATEPAKQEHIDTGIAPVYMGGGMLGNGINYVQGETTQSNSLNESISVDNYDQALYLTTLGMSSFGQGRSQKLSQEGAAELLWGLVIGPLQQRN